MNLNELTADERTSLLAQARQTVLAEIAPGSNGSAADDTIAQLREQLKVSAFADVADLSAARDEMLTQMESALKAEYQRMQKNAGAMLAEMMAGIKREQHIAEFAARVTGGTDKTPHGLPVGREEVETFLGGLNDQQRQAAESIIGRTWEQGFVSFAELGHGKEVAGGVDLPEYIINDLESGELTVKELSNPILGLGDLSRYNLGRWNGGQK